MTHLETGLPFLLVVYKGYIPVELLNTVFVLENSITFVSPMLTFELVDRFLNIQDLQSYLGAWYLNNIAMKILLSFANPYK